MHTTPSIYIKEVKSHSHRSCCVINGRSNPFHIEGLAESIEDGEEPLVFQKGKQDTIVILGSNSITGGRGTGSGGGGGGDEPTNLEPEPSDSKREEEDEEEEEMADTNLEWMTQGPLALHAVLHKMPRRAERMNFKFNPDNMVKVEDHLDNLYLQLQTLEVCYDDVACRLFPYILDGHTIS